MSRLYVYMPKDLYEKIKEISNQEQISMSTLLKVAFVDKYSKIYPDLFKIKREEIKNNV